MEGQTTIGIIGGGQLGRMLTLAALPLGFKVVVVDPTENCPAAQVGAKQIKANLYDEAAIKELGNQTDYITVEIEHLNTSVLKKLVKSGKSVNPAPETIELIQDKYKQKIFLNSHKVPVAPFAEISNLTQAKVVLKKFNGKMLLKTRHGAYDGRGNAIVKSQSELTSSLKKFGEAKLYAEEIIDFKKELAVMVARDIKGNMATYPVVNTFHERNICIKVLAPAEVDVDIQIKASKIATKAVGLLNGAGVFGVEMFLTNDREVLINEIAPRVHNSGHYTMNACATSQFEQHVRAITGLPLGSTDLLAPACAMINILGERNGTTNLTGLNELLAIPQTAVHIYGKSPTKVDRKMGHINSLGATVKQAQHRARKARKLMDI